MAGIILVLLIIAIVTAFSVQNAAPVMVSFLIWKFEASIAIVIFLSVLSGLIIGALITSLLRIRRSKQQKTR